MTRDIREQLLLTTQAHGLYIRLLDRVQLDARLEPVVRHAYRRYQRRLDGTFRA